MKKAFRSPERTNQTTTFNEFHIPLSEQQKQGLQDPMDCVTDNDGKSIEWNDIWLPT